MIAREATWLNEPRSWEAMEREGTLIVTSDPATDFWRLTHDNGLRDNGHLFAHSVQGDFTATVCVRGAYRSQYDQAGLMVRRDDTTWLKTGIEMVDGVAHASAVVTRDSSDWSLTAHPGGQRTWFRVLRYGATIEVALSHDGSAYTLIRQCTLTSDPVSVGPFCASPAAVGFTATFENFTLTLSR